MNETHQVHIHGQVQGVGFRPFVYNLAKKYKINGIVSNDHEGVFIQISASEEVFQKFLKEVIETPPPSAIIKKYTYKKIAPVVFDDFKIIPTPSQTIINLPLTPDFGICNSCIKELRDIHNRRYFYPFITCVNCGPRYSIIRQFPFERYHTSVSTFKMCPTCQSEYENPTDKRFHSQTNTCHSCGIKMEFEPSFKKSLLCQQEEMIPLAAEKIKQGRIVCVKNTSGYLLCCDASNAEAVKRLRSRKRRKAKPFALMFPNMAGLKQYIDISEAEEKVLQSVERPIVIIPFEKTNERLALSEICPNLKQLGVMLPNSGVFQVLLDILSRPIVATSANIHGSPIIADKEEARKQLSSVAEYFLHHNLKIEYPQDDSVLKFIPKNKEKIMLRRSRGYAPNIHTTPYQSKKKILALGAQLKSHFLLSSNTCLYLSQHVGDLDNFETFERYKYLMNNYLNMFNSCPDTIITDKNPNYQSSIWGRELASKYGAEWVQVQHHKAHFASVLGEHDCFSSKEKILGVVWDGTGYGDDGNIWGGEFFIYHQGKLSRVACFEPFDWILNDKMAKEPRLSLLSLLHHDEKKTIREKFTDKEWPVYQKILQQDVLQTTSVGRLIDAVSSLLNICDFNTYEGEAAMRLENAATLSGIQPLKDYLNDETYDRVPTKLIMNKLYEDWKKGVGTSQIAGNFFYTLACAIIRMADYYDTKTIAVSGGVFQNGLLINILLELANKNAIKIKKNSNLPANDENIAFGQYMYYINKI